MYERLISQLAHVELSTPRLEESARFLTDVMGLQEAAATGNRFTCAAGVTAFFHSVQLTESSEPGLGHIGWRTQGPVALERAVERLERAGRASSPRARTSFRGNSSPTLGVCRFGRASTAR